LNSNAKFKFADRKFFADETKTIKYYYRGIKGILPLKIRRKTKVINGNYKKNTIIKNTSYKTYDINKILLPKEYYRRKP